MPSDVLPYFVPSPETVEWLPWLLIEGGTERSLPHQIDGWEPGTSLSLRRDFRINVPRLESETQSSVGHLVINVSWRSSTTYMVGSIPPLPISPTGLGTIDVELDGNKLAGTVSLHS